MIADHVGGGFGSKASLGIDTIAAIELGARGEGAVRVALDRHELGPSPGTARERKSRLRCCPREGNLKALSLTAYS